VNHQISNNGIAERQEQPGRFRKGLKRAYGGSAVVIGFILSPLSWWNDLVVNIPLSYAFAVPFGAVDRQLFIPMFIAGYWLSNVLGFFLMHLGAKNILAKTTTNPKPLRKVILQNLGISLVYTLLILALVWLDIVRFPTEYLPEGF
jgi:hypothetical protein